MDPNKEQFGGTHYQTQYQHWDLVARVGMDYFAGNATKYVSRYRKKNGIQDLQKARHYLDKLITVIQFDKISKRLLEPSAIRQEVLRFADANQLNEYDQMFIYKMCTFINLEDLLNARKWLTRILGEARDKELVSKLYAELNVPGTPEDGGEHSKFASP